MKNKILSTVAVLSFLAGSYSCNEETPKVSLVKSADIQLVYASEGFSSTPPPPAGKEVKLRSQQREYTVLSGEDGIARFTDIHPDRYNLSVTSFLTEEEKTYLTEAPGSGIKVFANGVIGNVDVFYDLAGRLELNVGRGSNILISKVYYSGSEYYLETARKTYNSDQYIELYNNSDEPIEMENIYIGLTDTDSKHPFQDERETRVYVKDIWRFPARDLLPGESIVVAREGRDHTIQSPLSLDLSSADYETKGTGKNYTPNPNTPELPIVYNMLSTLDNLSLLNKGGNGIVIFQTDEDPLTWPTKKANPNSAANSMHYEVRVNNILDAVETLPYKNPMDLNAKRLNDKLDATYVAFPSEYSAGYKQVSFDRKVIGITEDGRKILKDTNNSIEDFVTLINDLAIRDYDKEELYDEFTDDTNQSE